MQYQANITMMAYEAPAALSPVLGFADWVASTLVLSDDTCRDTLFTKVSSPKDSLCIRNINN
jgi:hypothetical protein